MLSTIIKKLRDRIPSYRLGLNRNSSVSLVDENLFFTDNSRSLDEIRHHYSRYIRSGLRLNDADNVRRDLICIINEREELDEEIQQENGWSREKKSINIRIEEDARNLVREPEPYSTDGARSNKGYERGVHCWKIVWNEKQRGTHATIGVASDNFGPLQLDGYLSMVGRNDLSWGWDLVHMNSLHGSSSNSKSYPQLNWKYRRPPAEITVFLDMNRGQLMFVTGNKFLGVAHQNLRGKKLHLIIGAVWGNAKIALKYHGCICEKPPTLLELSTYTFKCFLRQHCRYNISRNRLTHRWHSTRTRNNNQNQQLHYINNKSNVNEIIDGLNLPSTLQESLKKSMEKPYLF